MGKSYKGNGEMTITVGYFIQQKREKLTNRFCQAICIRYFEEDRLDGCPNFKIGLIN